MRTLMLHANKFQVNVVEPSSRPFGIVPELKRGTCEAMDECLVVFFCIEKKDETKEIIELEKEIINSAKDLGVKKLMLSPFVHLSKNIARPEKAKGFYLELLRRLKETDYHVDSSHFGYHKSLLLDIKGHPGSFRYREF